VLNEKEEENKMYGKKLSLVIGILILGFLGSVWASDLKIASVDIQRAINECQVGIEAKKAFTKELEKVQRLFEERQKELQTTKESLEKQGLMLTSEARAAKEKEFQNKLREFQRWQEDNQNELNQKWRDTQRNISLGLLKIIQKIGGEEGYSLILAKDENIVLYSSKSTDLTDRIVKAYDAQKK
jgi:outer membrane protein